MDENKALKMMKELIDNTDLNDKEDCHTTVIAVMGIVNSLLGNSVLPGSR